MTRAIRASGKIGGTALTSGDAGRAEPGVGKRTLVEQLPAPGAGAALPEAVRGPMERAFGADFSAVRVHQGEHVAALGARAFARGADIHFAPGQYAPGTRSGDELLGHELTHVVQQAQGRVAATAQASGLAINDSDAFEREADDHGARAARGEQLPPAGIAASTAGVIQGMFLPPKSPDRDNIHAAARRSSAGGWNEAHADKLIDWVIDVDQAFAVLRTLRHAEWQVIERMHPGGVTHKNDSALRRLHDNCAQREAFSAKAQTPDQLRQDQLDRVLDERDRSVDAKLDISLDRKTNYANCSVFFDGVLAFAHLVPFPSGPIPRNEQFKTAEHHLNSDDDPVVRGEEKRSHGDSEVAMLQALDNGLKQREEAVLRATTISIQIVSSYGACDNCKDRLDDFVARWKTARIEYYYTQHRDRQYGSDTLRRAAYGWQSDSRDTVVETLSHGQRYLFCHTVDIHDLERRKHEAELLKPRRTEDAAAVHSNANDEVKPEAKPDARAEATIDAKQEAKPDAKPDAAIAQTPTPTPTLAVPTTTRQIAVTQFRYALALSTAKPRGEKAQANATAALRTLLNETVSELQLTVEDSSVTPEDGRLVLRARVGIASDHAYQLRTTVHQRVRQGISFFAPVNTRQQRLETQPLTHDLAEI